MRYPKLRELKEAIRALIQGPYTSRFPFQPHQPYERFRGKPEFHQEDCIGCTACAQVCPARAIDFADKIESGKAKRIFTLHWDLCIFCGQCQANCPTNKGIMLSREFDLATTQGRQELKQEIEKELLCCGCCGEVIAAYDHCLWVVQRLGPLVFSNTTLMFLYLKEQGLAVKEAFVKKEKELSRADRLSLLCPRCRREIVLKS